MNESSGGQVLSRVESQASNDPFVRRGVISLLLLGFGAWTFIDFYVLNKYADGSDINTHATYLMNKWAIFILGPLGLIVLIRALVERSRRLVADEKGIGFAGKPQIAWTDITRVDATLLAAKGLLTIYHGQNQAFKLDSYYYRNFRDIAAFMEQHVPAEKIAK